MNLNRLFAIILVFCSSIPLPLWAQTDNVDTYITAQMKRRSIPGLALAVIRHGKVIKMRGLRTCQRRTGRSRAFRYGLRPCLCN
jgi:hypothetical protein